MDDNKYVLIALPTYNEEEAIGKMLEQILRLEIPVIVVDAGSTDKTVELTKEYQVSVFDRTKYGKGYGCGIMKAFDIAYEGNFEWLLILDSDMTYPVNEIPNLINSSVGYDLVIGVRAMKNIDFWRRLANKIHCKIASVLYGRQIADINSGMRMFRVSKFYGHITERNMGMIPQTSSFAMRNNLNIREIPVSYNKRVGESKTDFIDGIVVLWCIVRERFRKKVYL